MTATAKDTPRVPFGRDHKPLGLPAVILLEVFPHQESLVSPKAAPAVVTKDKAKDETDVACRGMEVIPVPRSVAERVPYIMSALSEEWNQLQCHDVLENEQSSTVKVFLPDGCSVTGLQVLLSRLDLQGVVGDWLSTSFKVQGLAGALELVQLASMLQLEELRCELTHLIGLSLASPEDIIALREACESLVLPQELYELCASTRLPGMVSSLPSGAQVRGMIASALATGDGKVWNVVQKVIERRDVVPRLAEENAAILLEYANGAHGNIRSTPRTGFYWGSRDFLYTICRYAYKHPEHFDAIVSAMFDSVYNMDSELPGEIVDAVFKELLIHEEISTSQCAHVVAKLMQRDDQLEYLFQEWSGVFATLPSNVRHALSKGLLPVVGRCPHTALDFILRELDEDTERSTSSSEGTGSGVYRLLKWLGAATCPNRRIPLRP